MSRIEGHKELIRDDTNMSIINADTSAYLKAKTLKDRISRQSTEINTLKGDIKEMKELLTKISEKVKWQEQ